MKDIKFLGTDGDFLLLETAEGQRFRLLVDDAVRRASRGEASNQLDAPSISPREIQEEIRVGRTIEEIVRASGAPEEYVRKFAQPVLDELNHAVLNALTVRLEIAGDRFNEPMAREFGEIIKSRLAASGAGIERWSALKAPDHGFFIYCEFEINGETKKATWSYDPKRLALAPENETAIALSSQDRLANQAPRLRPVATKPSGITQNLGETVDLAASRPATSAPLLVSASEETETNNSDTKLSETADLLDALRKKRNALESVEDLEPHPPTEGLRVVELDPDDIYQDSAFDEVLTEPTLEVVPDPTPDPAPAPVSAEPQASPKRGRASIPSWDEIVFGTKTED
jgi:urease gamma subunit